MSDPSTPPSPSSPSTPPNVKIYERPEPKRISPTVLAIILLVLVLAGWFGYHALHPAPSVSNQAVKQIGVRVSHPAQHGLPGFISPETGQYISVVTIDLKETA